MGEEDLEITALDAQVAVAMDDLQGRCHAAHHIQHDLVLVHIFRHLAQDDGIVLIVKPPVFRGIVPVADLLHAGLGVAIGIHDAVAAEIVVRLPVTEVAAVAQNFLTVAVYITHSLVHEIPDKTALVHGKFLSEVYIRFHAAQGIAHIVHIFAGDVGLARIACQVFPDIPGGSVHPGLHVRGALPLRLPVGGRGLAVGHAPGKIHALIVDQAAVVHTSEILCHGHHIGAAEGLVAAGPEEDGHMVLIPLKHGFRPVQHDLPPLRPASRHIPAGLDGIGERVLLPGAVGLQIGFIHQVDALLVAQVVPLGSVGIVAGADGVDIIGKDGLHGRFHVRNIDGPALGGAPLMAVDAVDHEPLAV